VEFSDKENFNWSCRTHSSEWGGTVWWCCGKTDFEAPGCKFSKHVAKDENLVEEGGEEAEKKK
jgi:hypothetical protein